MTDDYMSEHDGPTLEEMHLEARDWRRSVAKPGIEFEEVETTLAHRPCVHCHHDAATNPSKRELEVLEACVSAGSQKIAAKRLGISVQTVKNTISHLLARTGRVNSIQLAYMLGRGDFKVRT